MKKSIEDFYPPSEPVISSTDLEMDRESFLSSQGVSPSLISQTLSSTLLLVPDPEAHGVSRPTFPAGTNELFHHLRDALGEGVDIATNDDDYAEISLHGELLSIPTVLTSLALSVVGNAIWDWIKLRLGKRVSAARLKAKIVSIKKGRKRLRLLEYDGPAESFMALLKSHAEDDEELDRDVPKS